MATRKVLGVKFAVKFGAVNKSRLIGVRKGHTRTGACTSVGKCNHGRVKRGR